MKPIFTSDGQYTAAHWRQRAEEARARAEDMHDATAKATMSKVAEMYDRMAARAERREASSDA